ncbi:MAG TPA: glutamine synthetase family protein [Gemmatimonadales bacterium]|nr:glutamine synthetase family protein [Gemmatimonadales bacterium]
MASANLEKEVLEELRRRKTRSLVLQFTDLLGVNKAVELPASRFERALAGEVAFDGSALEGFARTEEADALLVPDLTTFRIFAWGGGPGAGAGADAVGRLICDIRYPDGRPFEGCPRTALKRQIDLAAKAGYVMRVGCEVEFFVFEAGDDTGFSTHTADRGSYFDLQPLERSERVRRAIATVVEDMELDPESLHHEVAPGQHEIDLAPADALTVADRLATLRTVVRSVALQHGMVATFMPKPLYARSGSGLHTHQTLLTRGKNAFDDEGAPLHLSQVARWYVGGLLSHARGYCAVTNPLVNSYKRLVGGFEAPVNVSWSTQNVSPLVRIPAERGDATRCENRLPDPAANPYLAIAAQLAAGLAGVKEQIDPGDPVNKNIARMSYRERRKYRIDDLPRDLHEALDYLEKDRVIRDALGEHIYERYVDAKRGEWEEYIERVSPWEVERYMGQY